MIKNYKLILFLILIAQSFQTQIFGFSANRQLDTQNDFSLNIQTYTDKIDIFIYFPSNFPNKQGELMYLAVDNTKQLYDYKNTSQQDFFQVSIYNNDIEEYFKRECPNSICKIVFVITDQEVFELYFYISFISNTILDTSISYQKKSIPFIPICSTCNIPEQDKVPSTITDVQCLNSLQEYCSPVVLKVLSEDQISITQTINDSLKFSTLQPLVVYIDYQMTKKYFKQNIFRQYITDYSINDRIYGQITYTFAGFKVGKGQLKISSKVLNGDFNKNKIRIISKYSYLTNIVELEAFRDESEFVQDEKVVEEDKKSSEQIEKSVEEIKSREQNLKIWVIILSAVLGLMLIYLFVECCIKKRDQKIQPYEKIQRISTINDLQQVENLETKN